MGVSSFQSVILSYRMVSIAVHSSFVEILCLYHFGSNGDRLVCFRNISPRPFHLTPGEGDQCNDESLGSDSG